MLNAGHIKPELRDYIASHSTPPDPVLEELSHETASRYPRQAHMQVDPVQGSLLTVLARAAKAQLAIEIGTFTGYSSICIARGLAPGGKLICCDVSEEWTTVARKYWEKAGLDDRVDLRLGPALETVSSFPYKPIFDLAFIDGDKDGYLAYWLELVPRMRPGGLLLVDNAFWGGEVVGFAQDGRVMYIREFNDLAAADPRVDLAMTPVADGLLVACPKPGDQAHSYDPRSSAAPATS
jgi:caffeoyl-CoA O-methyltransferase